MVEDEQIMRQVRDGEVNRLEVLFDRHQRALLHYFLHLTGNRAASEDLVQEAFFRVLKYRRSYQTENTFRAWLFQIGRNAYLDQLGRRKNEVAWAAEAPEASSPDAAPDRLMEEKQETALLRQALAELPPEKREVVDNFAGAIHVTGGGSQIEVTLVRHNRADSAEKLAEAKREVKLEISEQGGEVKLHQDYHYGHHDDREGYRVAFDYDIQVPAGTALSLDNFNSEIAVKGTSGDFDLHAFNGHIEVDDVTGAGNVHTFNGPVKIAFRRNPERDLKVKTFNGPICPSSPLVRSISASAEACGRPTRTILVWPGSFSAPTARAYTALCLSRPESGPRQDASPLPAARKSVHDPGSCSRRMV